MSFQQTILQTLKSALPKLEKKYGIKTLALFGSHSHNTAIAGESDIDLMVDFSQPIGIRFVDLAEELEQILHQKVDLVSRNAIKPKYYKAIEHELIYV
jgi:uncharacterized protein